MRDSVALRTLWKKEPINLAGFHGKTHAIRVSFRNITRFKCFHRPDFGAFR